MQRPEKPAAQPCPPPTPAPPPECAAYLRPYRAAVDRIGPRFEALLWSSPQTQKARFRVVTDMLDFSGRTVLDAGCGRADFARWLCQERIGYARYVGLDGVGEMVRFAQEQGLPNACFRTIDFVADPGAFIPAPDAPIADIVLFSGSLNTIPEPAAMQALDRAWLACREALVFNFLSVADPAPGGPEPTNAHGPARRFSTAQMLVWAQERTPLVALRTDYLDGQDATIVMRKPRA